jgi:hypothetical protein
MNNTMKQQPLGVDRLVMENHVQAHGINCKAGFATKQARELHYWPHSVDACSDTDMLRVLILHSFFS